LFAKYGLGLGNDERGFAVKTLLQMTLHRMLEKNEITREELKVIAENAGDPVNRLYTRIFGESVEVKPCTLCGNKLSRQYFEAVAEAVAEKLREHNATRFVVGVTIPQETLLKEIEIESVVGLETAESIKNEIKREVGKIVRDRYGFTPDFDNPEVMVIVDFTSGDLELVVSPILLEGRYWKRGRNVSHTPWFTASGDKLYPQSLQEFFDTSLREVFEAEEVVIHASGREDVDARMLGTGRPLVVEVKKPKFRLVALELVNELLQSDMIEARLITHASRSRIEYLKGVASKKKKVYKLLVYSKSPLSFEALRVLEEKFENATVKQLTPTRILRRKKEHLRLRRVYEVKCKLIDSHLFETIIHCDGGLYVKELVHGDNGRTTPSYAEVLNTELYPVEIDVLAVET